MELKEIYNRINNTQDNIGELEDLSNTLNYAMQYSINNQEDTSYLITLMEIVKNKISRINDDVQYISIDILKIMENNNN